MLLVTITIRFLEESIGTKEGFDFFFMWCIWQGFVPGQMYVLAVYTHTHLSLSTESQWPDTYGWHCALTMSLLPSLCRPFPFYYLSPLFAGASAEQRPHGRSKNT